jgi:hypothetical protein
MVPDNATLDRVDGSGGTNSGTDQREARDGHSHTCSVKAIQRPNLTPNQTMVSNSQSNQNRIALPRAVSCEPQVPRVAPMAAQRAPDAPAACSSETLSPWWKQCGRASCVSSADERRRWRRATCEATPPPTVTLRRGECWTSACRESSPCCTSAVTRLADMNAATAVPGMTEQHALLQDLMHTPQKTNK